MNNVIISNINELCSEDDLLISVGDLFQYNIDEICDKNRIKPNDFIKNLNVQLINIEGNHDKSNKVKSIGTSLRTTLGKRYISVSVSHYPSNHPKAKGGFRKGDVHIHGHIHNYTDIYGKMTKPNIFTIDRYNKVLNVNVNCELWDYKPISEEELIVEIDRFMIEENRKRGILFYR